MLCRMKAIRTILLLAALLAGGTVLIAYLSSLVNPKFTATQYALLSSIMSLFPKLVAGYAGNVQESVGWLGFFLYAAALGVPAILLAAYVGARHERYVGNGGGG